MHGPPGPGLRSLVHSNFTFLRWTKEHFQVHCSLFPLGEGLADYLRSFSASLVGWRFGSVVEVARALLQLQPLLTACWDPVALQEMDTKLTHTVMSPLFWSYTKVVLRLEEILEHFSRWAECCPCHLPPGVIGGRRWGNGDTRGLNRHRHNTHDPHSGSLSVRHTLAKLGLGGRGSLSQLTLQDR